ncbi:Ribosomal S15 protein [Paramecium bursaria]
MQIIFRFATSQQKALKPGDKLLNKAYLDLLKSYKAGQPLENVKKIQSEFGETLTQRYKFGFTEEELQDVDTMIKKALSLNNSTLTELLAYRTNQAIRKYQRWPLDTASPGVKVAVLSERVIHNMMHMERNRVDYKASRALRKLIQQRRDAINYLRRREYHLYKQIIDEYGIIDQQFGNHHWLEHDHKMPQVSGRLDRIETNIGRYVAYNK